MTTPPPDSDPAPVPAATGDADRTVRLARTAAGGTETVRLGSGSTAVGPNGSDKPEGSKGSDGPDGPDASDGPATGGPDAEATVRIDANEAMSATFLDPGVWGGAGETVEELTLQDTPAHGTAAPADPASASAPAFAPTGVAPPSAPSAPSASATPSVTESEDERPLAPGELRRFGPGVPPLAAAVWHGAAVPGAEPPRRRRVWRRLLPPVLLLAVLALLFWRFSTPALAVTGVGVTTDPAGPGCDSVAVIKAEVATDGGSGTLRYRWLRSDGTTSGEIDQAIGSGARRTELVLRWSFEGRGSLAATATLEILAPGSRSAAVSFPYHCA
ncbi:hypothetical protein ACFZCK_35155 [Kitasatospora purpeofusca]|uniref:hypothetical protein n=1 Tax=Kitasatospora purpeofusca TaxID=67352 RepID=UPI0036E25E34